MLVAPFGLVAGQVPLSAHLTREVGVTVVESFGDIAAQPGKQPGMRAPTPVQPAATGLKEAGRADTLFGIPAGTQPVSACGQSW
jgi:hypothetical protein